VHEQLSEYRHLKSQDEAQHPFEQYGLGIKLADTHIETMLKLTNPGIKAMLKFAYPSIKAVLDLTYPSINAVLDLTYPSLKAMLDAFQVGLARGLCVDQICQSRYLFGREPRRLELKNRGRVHIIVSIIDACSFINMILSPTELPTNPLFATLSAGSCVGTRGSRRLDIELLQHLHGQRATILVKQRDRAEAKTVYGRTTRTRCDIGSRLCRSTTRPCVVCRTGPA
jgi:hypothetical protein